jgi:hypothetical protein
MPVAELPVGLRFAQDDLRSVSAAGRYEGFWRRLFEALAHPDPAMIKSSTARRPAAAGKLLFSFAESI